MKTELLPAFTQSERARASERVVTELRSGGVVALPTETVYGLAADALNANACLQIFAAKERPRFDPLIVHLPDREWLHRIAVVGDSERDIVERLANDFWPGPLTLVLERKALIPDIVTSGLETVAVRISAHPVFAEIVRAFGGPLAAPSANRFGRISPTMAEHVYDELRERIPLIVDAGPTTHGIESTIVAVNRDAIRILRRGPITIEQLEKFAEVTETENRAGTIESPGQLPSHYAPQTRLVLVPSADDLHPSREERRGLLAWRSHGSDFAEVRRLSETGDVREAAANLFRLLRELDQSGLDLIVAEELPDVGLGSAIVDRLRRAAMESSAE